MSIVSYTGLMGSGKSYGVVENAILPALRKGRTVVTNIPLNLELISETKEFKGSVQIFETKDITDNSDSAFFEELPDGCLWVCDEAWRLWESGIKATAMPESHKAFITEHRHLVGEDGFTTEIVLVTQDNSQLCAFVRNLIDETYRSSKLDKVGMKNRCRIDVYQTGVTGSNPPKSNLIRQIGPKKYKKEVWQYYKSHTKSEHVGMEEKADNRASIFKNPLIKYGIPVSILIFVFAISSVMSFFKGSNTHEPTHVETSSESKKNKQITGKGTSTNSASSGNTQEEDSKPALSDGWRVVGILKPETGENLGLAYLVSEYGARTIPLSMCKQEQGSPDWTCLLGKEIITQYSGYNPGSFRASRNNAHIARR